MVLEANRSALGDDVVDVTVQTLQERMQLLGETAELTNGRSPAQRKQATILFANVTGFTELAESLPETRMLDVLNILWQRLDSAITNNGGTIDKHMADGVLGVFGVPTAREDDAERAVRASLGMRAALIDFLNDVEALGAGENWQPFLSNQDEDPFSSLQLSIGINTGPVIVGDVGNRDEVTVIGDTVNVASRLQKHAASSGGILIAHDTYISVRGVFNVEPLGPVMLKGRSEAVPVYMVLGVKPRLFYSTGRGVEGIETKMVGRDRELRTLQTVLKTAVRHKTGRLVTIVGEAGVGKSRLLHEFSSWLKTLSRPFPSFKGRTYERSQQLPYGLFRDLFSAQFSIQEDDLPVLVENKMVQGLMPYWRDTLSPETIAERARTIGQLLGLNMTNTPIPIGPSTTSPRIREQAYQHIIELFSQITRANTAVCLFLEDIHWADDGSIELIERLAELSKSLPFIVIALARPSFFDQWPDSPLSTGLGTHALEESAAPLRLELRTLKPEVSQELVKHILRKIPDIPDALTEIIITRSEGNPFYLEELIKVLIEDGVILTGQETWQVQRKMLRDLRIPSNITGVLQARLDRLSALERVTLQRAAVVGRLFWDTAVINMSEQADEPISPADTLLALQALEKREMIFQRKASILSGSKTYIFKHSLLQQVAYESVLLRVRPTYHQQVADWLVQQSGERMAESASLIARHYELAGDKQPAAELYEIAGTRAQDAYKPELAIDYYRRSLALLTESSLQTMAQLRLQERMGDLLTLQGRFVEAAQTYMTMRYTATEDGDLLAQAEAWLGLAKIKREQAEYAGMLDNADQAEQVAWLVNAEPTLAQALLYKSEAYIRLGDIDLALTAVSRTLSLYERIDAIEGIVKALTVLANIHTDLGQIDEATQYLKQLEEWINRIDLQLKVNQPDSFKLEAANSKSAVGNLYNRLGRYDKAAFHLLNSLRLYRETNYLVAVANTLNTLGEAVRLRGNAQRAIPLYEEALGIAEMIGDQYGTLFYRTNLGAGLIDVGNYQTAVSELRDVISQAEDISKTVTWFGLVEAYMHLSAGCLGLEQANDALTAAQTAMKLAQAQRDNKLVGAAWRCLGTALARHTETAVIVDDRAMNAGDCFAESLQLLRNTAGIASYREQAITLQSWSQYETAQGKLSTGTEMQKDAEALAKRLRIQLPQPV